MQPRADAKAGAHRRPRRRRGPRGPRDVDHAGARGRSSPRRAGMSAPAACARAWRSRSARARWPAPISRGSRPPRPTRSRSPASLPRASRPCKAAHRRFMSEVETNQAVLATARSVSEGLIKTLAEEIGALALGDRVRRPVDRAVALRPRRPQRPAGPVPQPLRPHHGRPLPMRTKVAHRSELGFRAGVDGEAAGRRRSRRGAALAGAQVQAGPDPAGEPDAAAAAGDADEAGAVGGTGAERFGDGRLDGLPRRGRREAFRQQSRDESPVRRLARAR